MNSNAAGEGPALSEGLGANTAIACAPQRWQGRSHSPASAISAALRLLKSDNLEAETVTIVELLGICSELLFRATGERIRPAIDARTQDLPASLVLWCEDTPDDYREVMVRLASGEVHAAYFDHEESSWGRYGFGGGHPGDYTETVETKKGRRTVSEEVQRTTPVIAWADFPPDADLGA